MKPENINDSANEEQRKEVDLENLDQATIDLYLDRLIAFSDTFKDISENVKRREEQIDQED